NVAGRGGRQRLEARRAADLIGDGDIDGLTGNVFRILRRRTGTRNHPAGVVAQVLEAVAEVGRVGDQVDMVANRLERGNLFLQVESGAQLLWSEDARVHPQAPRPGTEAHRHLRPRGQRLTAFI